MSTVKNQASDFKWEVASNGEVVITGLVDKETAPKIVVPDVIERRPVTKIGADAFSGRSTLTSVALPIGLNPLGKGAFTGCKALTKFALSSNAKRLRVVDGVLFSGDGKKLLRYPPGKSGPYAVPLGTQTVAVEAFAGRETLTSVELLNGVKTVGRGAFIGAKSLTSVVFPDGLQSIGRNAFHRCDKLQSIALPNGLQTLGVGAFSYCEALTSVAFQKAFKLSTISPFEFARRYKKSSSPTVCKSSANTRFIPVLRCGRSRFPPDYKPLEETLSVIWANEATGGAFPILRFAARRARSRRNTLGKTSSISNRVDVASFFSFLTPDDVASFFSFLTPDDITSFFSFLTSEDVASFFSFLTPVDVASFFPSSRARSAVFV